METNGLNGKEIKARNMKSILYLLNSNSGMSRKEIADTLGLTPAAITKIINQLMDAGYISESGIKPVPNAKSGRKKIGLKLNLDEYYALCVNAEVDKVTVSSTRLDGLLIRSESIEITQDDLTIVNMCKKVIKRAGIKKSMYSCISVCVIGPVGKSSFGLWDNQHMKELLEKEIHLPVIMDNNIHAYALAEIIFGKTSIDDSVFFMKWGPGIGSAVAHGGQLLAGSFSEVAEIGHYIVRKDGRKCRCGRYGCLETVVSSIAIEREADNGMKFEEILSSDDEQLVYMVEAKIDTVALTLANTATILNADKVILFGSAFKNDDIFEKLKKQVNRYNNADNSVLIEKSSLNDKISYIGATALAAKCCFFDGLKTNGG